MFWARTNLRIPHSFLSVHALEKKAHKPVLFLCHCCIPGKQKRAALPCITAARAAALSRDAPHYLGTSTPKSLKLAEVPVLAAFSPFSLSVDIHWVPGVNRLALG